MMDMAWDEFWWKNITGAQIIISQASSSLLESKIVVLTVPPDFPWRPSMRSSIQVAFQERNNLRDVVIEPIDIFNDNDDDLEPGRFILKRFAPPAISGGYRERSRVTVQEYITQKGVIKNRIIWVKGLLGKTAEQWIDFCKGFSPKTVNGGLFVLEVYGKVTLMVSKYINVIDCSSNISCYDVQLLNSFILSSQDTFSDKWKKYIATTAALVCDVDAEVSEQLLRITDFKSEEPIEGIKRIAGMSEFAEHGTDLTSNNVLHHYRNSNISELKYRVWSAQIQVLFPIVELERIQMINKWEEEIRRALANNPIYQYGVIIKEPIDVELGTLCYMMAQKKDGDMYTLYVPDEDDRERIRFLHECRNILAHTCCCNPNQIMKLLN